MSDRSESGHVKTIVLTSRENELMVLVNLESVLIGGDVAVVLRDER